MLLPTNRIIQTAILTCLCSIRVFAGEQISVDRTLNWSETPRSFSFEEGRSILSLQFDGASYSFDQNAVYPVFSESFSIASQGTVTATLENAVYAPVDMNARALTGIRMQLPENIEISSLIGYSKKQPQLDVHFIPLRKNKFTGAVEKLISFTLVINVAPTVSNKMEAEEDYADNSVLASGSWYKISVRKDGVFKIDRSFLEALGMSGTISMNTIGVFGNGGGMLPESNSAFRYDDLQENAIYKNDANGNGLLESGDYILFYGQAPNRWYYNSATGSFAHQNNIYSDKTYYFISPDRGTNKIILSSGSVLTENANSFTYDALAFSDIDKLNLLNSGRTWYGDVLDIYNPSRSYSFSLPDMVTAEPVVMRSRAAGASTSGSIHLTYHAGATSPMMTIDQVTAGFTETYAYDELLIDTFNATSSNINISIDFSGSSVATSWLNYIELLGRSNIKYNNAQLIFRDSRNVGAGNITQYHVSGGDGTMIWDVTHPVDVNGINYTVSGSEVNFTRASDSLKEYIVFKVDDVFPSSDITDEGTIANQNLHNVNFAPDFVIVSHPSFMNEARRLAGFHHDTQGLDTMVVDINQIYNEFSSGGQDISAIRDFMRMFYERAGTDETKMPQYLLLMGDASFDYKYITFNEEKNTLKIPNYESEESLAKAVSYGTDDYYGFLDPSEGDNIEDESEKLDIGVGRLPVMTAEEAGQMVDKMIHYKSTESLGSWRNTLTFLADDEDYNTHEEDAEILSSYVASNYPVYNIDKIYFDSYQQIPGAGGERYPDVEVAINNQIYTGSFIMNYLGHGNEQNWAQERVLSVDDINGWTNYDKLPLFITATCSFSRYDNPDLRSAGELCLMNPDGGAIGLVTTVRLVYASANLDLNENLIEHLFANIDGKKPALGDVVRLGKNAVVTDATNNRKFILLGDPALVLNYPTYKVATTEVNGFPIATYTDTLKALDKVTIKGQVADETGVKLTSFNGIVYPAVFDKPVTINTLVNDPTFSGVGFGPSEPFSFQLQKNALYKGKASVVNGDFEFTFIVPKDISYTYGNGKLSYYADNGADDANGYDYNVIIGGTADDAPEDDAGPLVDVYMNDESFVFGGLTDEDPVLLIKLNDNSGINALGNAVGHDITATLDEDQQTMLKLNDYYEADLDQYQSGTVSYPLSDVAEGRHSVSVKAWDVYNNSGDGYTEFVVASSADLALSHVLNYPNPFTTHTSFWFEHNRPGDVLDVKVEIFTVSGKRIKTLQQQVSTEGYRVDDIEWDGLDEFGDPIGKGVYVYKVTVKAESDNSKASEFQKLVILK